MQVFAVRAMAVGAPTGLHRNFAWRLRQGKARTFAGEAFSRACGADSQEAFAQLPVFGFPSSDVISGNKLDWVRTQCPLGNALRFFFPQLMGMNRLPQWSPPDKLLLLVVPRADPAGSDDIESVPVCAWAKSSLAA